jgi:hypothetical protein
MRSVARSRECEAVVRPVTQVAATRYACLDEPRLHTAAADACPIAKHRSALAGSGHAAAPRFIQLADSREKVRSGKRLKRLRNERFDA